MKILVGMVERETTLLYQFILVFVQEIVRVKGAEKYYSSSKVYDTPAHLSQALT